MSNHPPTIFIISGGVGSSGEHLVNTVLAQYPDSTVKVNVVSNVRQAEQVLEPLRQAQQAGALVVHTLVDQKLRSLLAEQAQRLGVPAIDLFSPLFAWLTPALGVPPVETPGLYRKLHRIYFDRVAAIDFTMAQDDGKNPDGWAQADAVLVGVSRVGKTPLSLYLAVLGWKVANYPLVPQIPPPAALFALDPSRVFGLTISFEQLLIHRMQRQRRLGTTGPSDYVDPEAVKEELLQAKKIFREAGFHLIDMTDKPIELAADEILRQLEPRR
jgi:hypothetical protein